MIKTSKKLNKLFTEMMDLCSELHEDSPKFLKIDYEFPYTEHPIDVIDQTLLAIEQSQKKNIPLIRLEDLAAADGYSIYLVIAAEHELEFKLKSAIKELENLKNKEQEKIKRTKKSRILKEIGNLKRQLSILENSLEEIKLLELKISKGNNGNN